MRQAYALGPIAASGLLLLLTGCASTSSSLPPADLQVTSALDYRPLDKDQLEDPYISMRVQFCETIGGSHCRALRMPVDRIERLEMPPADPLIAFITLRGLGPAVDLNLQLTVTDAHQAVTWSKSWTARTTDDFAPRLPFYRTESIPAEAFASPGTYTLRLITNRAGQATSQITIGAAPKSAGAPSS